MVDRKETEAAYAALFAEQKLGTCHVQHPFLNLRCQRPADHAGGHRRTMPDEDHRWHYLAGLTTVSVWEHGAINEHVR